MCASAATLWNSAFNSVTASLQTQDSNLQLLNHDKLMNVITTLWLNIEGGLYDLNCVLGQFGLTLGQNGALILFDFS